MSATPAHLVVVHNNIDQGSSIGKLASWSVTLALELGWRVTAVARDLDPALHGEVDWRPLYVPPRLHALQWAVAEPTVRRALHGVDFDLLHTFQPQLTGIADTWQVAYLSQAAIDAGSLDAGTDLRARIHRAEARAVAFMEDRYLRRYRDEVTVLWCSERIRDLYVARYGQPRRSAILYNPALDTPRAPSPSRSAASIPDAPTTVTLGYLGGMDARKGYRELLDAVAVDARLRLVAAGPRSERMVDNRLTDRLTTLGWLEDLDRFWSQIDVLVVPSRFEPFGMVVAEAAARGIPSIVTKTVGVAEIATRAGVAAVWDGSPASLGDRASALLAGTNSIAASASSLMAELDPQRLGRQLTMTWQSLLHQPAGSERE